MDKCGMIRWVGAIVDERVRQVNGKGHDEEHDDNHTDGEICNYAAHLASRFGIESIVPGMRYWDKKSKYSRKKQLIVAGALIIAELERLERAGEIT